MTDKELIDRARAVGAPYRCSDPPEESCSDAGCPVHGNDGGCPCSCHGMSYSLICGTCCDRSEPDYAKEAPF